MKDYEQRATAIIMNTVEGVKAQIRKAYNRGYEDGKADTPFTDTEEAEKKAYEKGLNDAWEAARKIEHPNGYFCNIREVFGEESAFSVLLNMTASEAIQKIKEYEEKQTEKSCYTCEYEELDKSQEPCWNCTIFDRHSKWTPKQTDEIKVGDEIISYTETSNIVVGIGVWGGWHCITPYGVSCEIAKEKQKYWKKTGRHFDEIEKVLEQMKGDQE